jgi:hypothetical protein
MPKIRPIEGYPFNTASKKEIIKSSNSFSLPYIIEIQEKKF